MFIKAASSPRLSGIKMHSPILWSHLLKMQRIVLLSSLLWWELGTNSLITGPGEWLSFRRFTSKLSWPWVNRWKGWVFTETFPSIYGRDKSVYFRSWGCYVPYNAIIIRKKKKKKEKLPSAVLFCQQQQQLLRMRNLTISPLCRFVLLFNISCF